MAKNSRGDRRQQRARAKLQESGVGAIALGIAFLLLPAFFTSPVTRAVAAGLKMPAWFAIIVGSLLLALHRFIGKRASASAVSPAAKTPRQRDVQRRAARVGP